MKWINNDFLLEKRGFDSTYFSRWNVSFSFIFIIFHCQVISELTPKTCSLKQKLLILAELLADKQNSAKYYILFYSAVRHRGNSNSIDVKE
jgi:hypothetical protein